MTEILLTFFNLSRHSPITAPPLPGNFTADPYCKIKSLMISASNLMIDCILLFSYSKSPN